MNLTGTLDIFILLTLDLNSFSNKSILKLWCKNIDLTIK